jgi:hypothetical protein
MRHRQLLAQVLGDVAAVGPLGAVRVVDLEGEPVAAGAVQPDAAVLRPLVDVVDLVDLGALQDGAVHEAGLKGDCLLVGRQVRGGHGRDATRGVLGDTARVQGHYTPYCGGMAGANGEMAALLRASAAVERADADRADAMRKRDEALRAAHSAGATYAAIREATGMSPATISKALRRE